MKPRMSNTSDTWIFSWQYLLQLPLNRDGLPESLQSSLSRLSLNTSCHSQSQRSFTHKHTTTFLAAGDSDRIHRISCDYCNRSRCSCRINRDNGCCLVQQQFPLHGTYEIIPSTWIVAIYWLVPTLTNDLTEN